MLTKNKYYDKKVFDSYRLAHKVAKKMFGSLRTIVSLGIQDKAIQMYKKSLKITEVWTVNKGFSKGIFTGVKMFFHNICYTIMLFIALKFNQFDPITYSPKFLMQMFFSAMVISDSINHSVLFFEDLDVAKHAALKVFKIIDTQDDDEKPEINKTKIYNLKGEISFENIDFTFSNESFKKLNATNKSPHLFKNFNLIIPAGKTVAICGQRYKVFLYIFNQLFNLNHIEIKVEVENQ